MVPVQWEIGLFQDDWGTVSFERVIGVSARLSIYRLIWLLESDLPGLIDLVRIIIRICLDTPSYRSPNSRVPPHVL